MTATLASTLARVLDANGTPVPGALIYTYAAGTSTPKATFTDSARTSEGANPIVCDAGGLIPLRYLATGSYKLTYRTSSGTLLRTDDDVPGDGDAAAESGVVTPQDYGAAGDGTTDDTAAFAAALATGNDVYVPPGNYKISSGLTMSTSGQRLYGAGPWSSIIEWAGGNNNVLTLSDDQYMAVRALMIRPLSGQSALGGGYAIAFAAPAANTLGCEVSDCLIYGMYNGILARSVTEAVIRDVLFWAITGTVGIRFDGTSGNPTAGLMLDHVQFGGMDGNTTTVLVDQNSYGYSLRMRQCVLVGGGTGFRMADDTAGGTSYPMWCIGSGNECDHNDDYGVDLQAGEGFSWGHSWIGSCLSGPGIATRSNWRGEMTLTGSRVMGCKTHGISLEAGIDAQIVANAIGDNSAGSSGTYHGVNVAAGVSKFIVVGNRIGDLVGAAGNAQGYAVKIATGASDVYQVMGNNMAGNVTGEVSDGGAGTTKLVQSLSYSFDRVSFGDASFAALLSAGNPAILFDSTDFASYSRSANQFAITIGGTTQFLVGASRMIVPAALPTSASGLSSGDLWRDAAADHVIKMVP